MPTTLPTHQPPAEEAARRWRRRDPRPPHRVRARPGLQRRPHRRRGRLPINTSRHDRQPHPGGHRPVRNTPRTGRIGAGSGTLDRTDRPLKQPVWSRTPTPPTAGSGIARQPTHSTLVNGKMIVVTRATCVTTIHVDAERAMVRRCSLVERGGTRGRAPAARAADLPGSAGAGLGYRRQLIIQSR